MSKLKEDDIFSVRNCLNDFPSGLLILSDSLGPIFRKKSLNSSAIHLSSLTFLSLSKKYCGNLGPFRCLPIT